MQSATPKELLLSVWPLSLSLATTQEISVDFSSSPYLDVSVQAVSLVQLFIHCTMTEVCSVGLLHSEIHGSKRTYRSPWLIAVNHVLRRLPMPRHSPCALISFTICFMLFLSSLELLILTCSFIYPISCVLSDFFYRLKLVVSSFALLTFLFSFQVPLFLFLRTDLSNTSVLLRSILRNLWWAQMDSNHRPHAYQACALTT